MHLREQKTEVDVKGIKGEMRDRKKLMIWNQISTWEISLQKEDS